MSEERTQELGEEDVGGGEEVREEEEEEFEEGEEIEELGEDGEFRGENEVRHGEEFWEKEGSYWAENDRETISASSSNKRNKEMSIDRLSALPDCVLIHILTFLGVRRAAVTSVLSKRWQYLWTDLPWLRFKDNSSRTEETCKFVSWVHRTLVLRSGNYLEKFSVNFAYDKCFASDVNVWVEFAVKNKVKELSLQLYSRTDFYMLPQVMYSSSSLTWLGMQRCIVTPQRSIEWQSLTSLDIGDVELHEHVIQKILSGCPVLDSLCLTGCWGFECLEVNSQSIYSLVVSDCEDENTGPLLEISAPYIRSLNISLYPIGRKKLRLTNIPSLVRADIHFSVFDISEEEMNDTMEFLEDIKHVKELQLGCQCIEIFATCMLGSIKVGGEWLAASAVYTRVFDSRCL